MCSEIGWFIEPQSISCSVSSSLTINLSLGERPVYLPVSILIAPDSVNTPSPDSKMCLYNSDLESCFKVVSLLRRLVNSIDSVIDCIAINDYPHVYKLFCKHFHGISITHLDISSILINGFIVKSL